MNIPLHDKKAKFMNQKTKMKQHKTRPITNHWSPKHPPNLKNASLPREESIRQPWLAAAFFKRVLPSLPFPFYSSNHPTNQPSPSTQGTRCQWRYRPRRYPFLLRTQPQRTNPGPCSLPRAKKQTSLVQSLAHLVTCTWTGPGGREEEYARRATARSLVGIRPERRKY